MARVCLDDTTTRAELERAMIELGWALERHLERGAFNHGGMVWVDGDEVATYTENASLYARVLEIPEDRLEDVRGALGVSDRDELLAAWSSAPDEVGRMELVLRVAALVEDTEVAHDVEDVLADALVDESLMVRRAAISALDALGWTSLDASLRAMLATDEVLAGSVARLLEARGAS